MQGSQQQLVRLAAAARQIGVTPATLRSWCRKRWLIYVIDERGRVLIPTTEIDRIMGKGRAS